MMKMKWVNSTAAAIEKGKTVRPDATMFNLIDTSNNDVIVGSVQVSMETILWWAGLNNHGSANSVGQAKSAVEKLLRRGGGNNGLSN